MTLSTIGKTNAATMSSAGSQYFLSRATPLLPAPCTAERSPRSPGPEHEHHDQDGEDHDWGPSDAYVLVGHGPDDADEEPADHRPGQVAYAPKDRRRERVESLLKPTLKTVMPLKSPYITPEAPARMPARRNVMEIVRLTLMPTIAAASLSWATARIAFPAWYCQ